MSREQNIQMLMDMGYPRDLSEEAISVNGYVNASIDWINKKQKAASLGGTYTLGGGEGNGQTLGGNTLGGNTLGGQSLGGERESTVEKSVSQPPVRLTDEERAERLNALEERMQAKKRLAEIQDRQFEIEGELRRREQGKLAQKQQEEWHRQQMINEANLKKKEREADKIARRRIKMKMEQDKLNREAERRAKAEAILGNTNTTNQTPQPSVPVTSSSGTVRLRFRTPSGVLSETFEPNATLLTLENYILSQVPNIGAFTMTNSEPPRRVFMKEEYHLTLFDANLVDRSQILVQKK